MTEISLEDVTFELSLKFKKQMGEVKNPLQTEKTSGVTRKVKKITMQSLPIVRGIWVKDACGRVTTLWRWSEVISQRVVLFRTEECRLDAVRDQGESLEEFKQGRAVIRFALLHSAHCQQCGEWMNWRESKQETWRQEVNIIVLHEVCLN